MSRLNETHDPALTSWVASASATACDFPIQNLPFGIFRRKGGREAFRGGVAIGDQILDLAAPAVAKVFAGELTGTVAACALPRLNDFMAMGPDAHAKFRLALSRALRSGSSHEQHLLECLVPQADAEYALPAAIGDYTDFYTSIYHATNIGRLFRPDNPLLPNYKWVPIGYHGRVSTIGVSGQSFPRPRGQTLPQGRETPEFGPSKRLDYELELGLLIGAGNDIGMSIPIAEAERHVFGVCLLNDWSARDIQGWEYQPLGPFLSKNFATTISPWVVTLEALAPFRMPWTRPAGDPKPLAYLDDEAVRREGALDIRVSVSIQSEMMRATGGGEALLARTSYRHAYWTFAQLVAHHSVNGCRLAPGDLLATGTLSGPNPDEACALIELTQGGKKPVQLPNSETRTFLQDGDAVILRGWCEREGYRRIGLGEARGTVMPAC
jgi:fumarylacetoacetase